ncbi:MAG: xanthine dehydrogenase family protein molybdopterin-binding subunit [Gammaproteobacteria bacterium]|nr:MAG: xanthine dehydrogenase family protein molybdopterin-binding subunit [Gammaproteobacteria bacterium]
MTAPRQPAVPSAATLNRRDFVVVTGASAAGLWLGLRPAPAGAAADPAWTEPRLAAYLEIRGDGSVIIVDPELEVGQGVHTSLPLILADELGADWERVEVRQSWADERFINPMKGIQATGRSMSVRGHYQSLRELGATARSLLCQAAATAWGVPAAECATQDGMVLHRPSGRRQPFSALAAAAAALPVPGKVELRPDAELRHLGRDQPRKDLPAKVTGSAEFGVDVRQGDLLVASVMASPVFGSPLVAVDEAPARAMPGVEAVVRLPDAVAVVARDFWRADTALRALRPEFARGPNDAVDSANLQAALRRALDEPGVSSAQHGEAPAPGPRHLQLEYEVPYLAHATLEPMTCTALVSEGRCQLWAPSQGPIRLRDEVAAALGLPAMAVSVQRTFAGGAFGRRWPVDYGIQAALIARAVPGRPVKLIWSRSEDMQHDFYRPAFAARIGADLDEGGRLTGMAVKLAGASIMEWGRPGRLKGKPDPLAVSTFDDTPYAIDAYRVHWVSVPTHVPIGTWRSVGQSHNGFFMECALDELAHAAGRDPLDFRLGLLEAHPRHQAVLRAVAKRAGWGRRLPKGEGLGLALVDDQGSSVAQVAHVRVRDGRLEVLEVFCAIDCGRALQPEVVRMQMEGGIIFGLSAALYGEIHIEAGRAVESNFHDYRMVTLANTPRIAVDIVEGGLPLGGVGEPGVPPVAPAVVNALFAATGQRIRSLPLARHGLVA